jgi:hypothetical protein
VNESGSESCIMATSPNRGVESSISITSSLLSLFNVCNIGLFIRY